MPVVLFNRNQDDERLSAVTSDNAAGGRKDRRLSRDAGGDIGSIGYIAGWEGASTQRDREAGFQNEASPMHGAQRSMRGTIGNFRYEEAAGFDKAHVRGRGPAGCGVRRQ